KQLAGSVQLAGVARNQAEVVSAIGQTLRVAKRLNGFKALLTVATGCVEVAAPHRTDAQVVECGGDAALVMECATNGKRLLAELHRFGQVLHDPSEGRGTAQRQTAR